MSEPTEIKEFNVLSIQDILRAQDVSRWTIINVTRPQSLAEHTFNVIAISRNLANKLGVSDTNIMKYAFDHDLDEILTGDVPTPAKDRLKLRDSYAGKNRAKCEGVDSAIVHVSDTIEAIWYVNIHGLGRKSAQTVDYLTEKLNNRIALFSPLHPKFAECVGELIKEIEYGDFAI